MTESVKSENALLEFLINKKWRIVRHLVMLTILAINIYPAIDTLALKKLNIPHIDLIVTELRKGTAVVYFMSVVLIYINLLILIPALLFKRKYIYYLISCMVLAVLYFLGEYFISRYLLKNLPDYIVPVEFSFKGFIDSTFIPLVFLSATAGYKIFKKWILDTRLLSEMKEAQIREELNSLKNQINPHFLFNTLNNLNTLVTTDPAKASVIILGLSDVLRYLLYEANTDRVLLRKDVEILRQLLELEKIRRDNFQFSLTVDDNIAGITVPPFIFIGFAENAVKHSADSKMFSYVTINFCVVEDKLLFCCKNSKPVLSVSSKIGGLGLQNIRRRLELIYRDRYSLEITDNAKEYITNLKIPI